MIMDAPLPFLTTRAVVRIEGDISFIKLLDLFKAGCGKQ